MSNEIKLPTYGGQAVIEGVMMRGRNSVAIAMRSPSQEIVIHEESLGGIYKSKITKIPFLRGLVMLWDALGLGIRALTISANTQNGEQEKIEGPALYFTVGTSLVLGITLFFLTPAALGHLTEYLIGLPEITIGNAAWLGNLTEGVARIAILMGYILLVGRIPEIQRVFAYHGAEHKTINAFEDGAELTPEVVSRYSLEHPRCGTAFLLSLVLISVILFSLIGPLPLPLRLLSRVIFLPLMAGLAYEYIRWTASHLNLPFVKMLIKPNLALQRLTTREPNHEMLEVSIAAFNAMRAKEQTLSL